ncbi:MAG: methyltransferase domain-containing protein [Deltaproteobacteria bacterium]|nr:methyltransferase domain-containing protein [Deltaproteobacteria bacterium]
MDPKDRLLADTFDGQAEKFERALLQSDAAALARLVAFAGLSAGSKVFDAGCGPGLVGEAFLEAGHVVHGIDLSAEMVRRARERCARFGERATFEQGSALDLTTAGSFDAAVSRLVVHHTTDPLAFMMAQVQLVRPQGALVLCDHTTDPERARARWHNEIERARDRSHARSLPPGELLELLARAGLESIRYAEEWHDLDFDEWFDRGTPVLPKAEVRVKLLSGSARGFTPSLRPDGGISIRGCWAMLCGVKPR